MKFICPKNELTKAIQINIKAISNKPQMPILSGVYIYAHSNILEIQSTDYDIGIICKIEADIKEEGSLVLPGKYFFDVIKTLPGDTIELSSSNLENTVVIKSNNAKFNLLSMASTDFPKIKQLESDNKFTIRSNILTELIKKTSFSCATEMIRPIFTGCLLDIDSVNLIMAGTNTHRLSVKKEILDNYDTNLTAKLVIPAKLLSDLSTLLTSDIPVDVNVTYTHNQISFFYDNIYIVSRLIEGQFPDYKNVIPTNFSSTAILKTHDFQSAIDRVSLISRSNQYNIINLDFASDTLLLSSINPEIGKAEESINVKLTGNPLSISFNAKYILDVLKYIDSDEIYFSFNNETSPVEIKPIDDDMYIYVVTPVRRNK